MQHQNTCSSAESSSSLPRPSARFDHNHRPNVLQLQPRPTNMEAEGFDTGSTYEEAPLLWDDLYSIEWTPKEFFLKLRQHVEGYQIGANLEFDVSGVNACNPKLVFKPVSEDRKWKVVVEPKQADVRLLTKKIPIGPFLSLQVGIGHEFRNHTTGWKWKLTSAYGGNGVSQIRHKTLLPVCPGFDIRVGWNAEYVLPDIHGALGTGEPIIGMNYGHLYGSLERVEAILTHTS